MHDQADQGPPLPKDETEREVKRDPSGLFQEGTKPGPGRPPGQPNNVPKHIKEVIRHLAAGALHLEGEKPIQELVVESLINGIKAPPPH